MNTFVWIIKILDVFEKKYLWYRNLFIKSTILFLLPVVGFQAYACTLHRWSNTENNAGMVSTVEDSSHFTENCGLRVSLDGSNSGFLEDQTPATLTPLVNEYFAQFDLFIDAAGFAYNDELEIFSIRDYNQINIASLKLIKINGATKTRLQIRDDVGFYRTTTTENFDLENGWQRIKLSWKAAYPALNQPGEFFLNIDGKETDCSSVITGINSAYHQVSSVRLGVISGNSNTITGSIDFDEFKSKREAGSAPVSCESSTINLPDNRWQQIALAGAAAGESTIGELLGDDLNAERYDEDWAVFSYDPQSNQYLNTGVNGVIEQGLGYWVIQSTGRDVAIDIDHQLSTPEGYTTGLFENTSTGWNMSGYSKPSSSQWDQFRIKTDAGICAAVDSCSIAEAAAKNIIHPQVWHYHGQGYLLLENSDSISAWSGFWCATLPGAQNLSPQLIHPGFVAQ